jgi:septin family protein
MRPRQVFDFSKSETDFRPSEQFKIDLAASRYPFIVVFIGNGRAGKSTRLNQLLLHVLKSDRPFEAYNGGAPVTMKFQYVGPCKFQQFSRLHCIDIQVDSDPDIFLIDCEGLHSLETQTAALKQATFALSQMASMTVLVMKEQVNFENVENMHSLLILSHAFSRQLPGFSIGTTIMMRDVGIRSPRGQQLTFDQKNCLRQQSDVEQRHKILDILNAQRVSFSDRDLLVLAQPDFEETDLYWKSIEDFLYFVAAIAVDRAQISGQSLLELFEEAKPSIMEVTDFSNPSIPFERIIQHITARYLARASSTAIDDCETEINEWLRQLKNDDLRRGLDVDFVGDMIVRRIRIFEERSEQLFPHLLEYSPEQTQNQRELIKAQVEMISNELFVERCIAVLLPEIEEEIVEGIKHDIATEMNEIPIAELGCFPFTTLSSRQERKGESQFQQSVLMIHPDIPKSHEFVALTRQLRENISTHVKDVENAKGKQYAEYREKEAQQEKAVREAQYQENLTKMQEEEAEKHRQLQEELDAAAQRLKEEQTRSEMEYKQNLALREEQLTQQKKHYELLMKMQEQSNLRREELFQKMMDEKRASDARIEAQNREDRRLQAENTAKFEDQIIQLANRPPTIIHKGGGGTCTVF